MVALVITRSLAEWQGSLILSLIFITRKSPLPPSSHVVRAHHIGPLEVTGTSEEGCAGVVAEEEEEAA